MVRDLDKLRTRSEFRLGPRHLALIVIGAAAGAGALFAVGLSLAGDDDRDRPEPRTDPLAALEGPAPRTQDSATTTTAAPEEPLPATAATSAPEMEPLRLTFHERLAAPAPAAPAAHAVPAAPLDDAMSPLAPDEPVVAVAAPTAQHNIPTLVPTPVRVTPPGHEPATPTVVTLVPALPTPVASTPAPQPLPPGNPDPIFEEQPTPALAQPGERGVFTLQVASYPTQEEAVAFMNTLRQRGHETFLVRATDEHRGVIWRVRVGPFSSQRDAERYRRTFERTERIPTFVVRRQLAEPAQVSVATTQPLT